MHILKMKSFFAASLSAILILGCGASGESGIGTDSVADRVEEARARNDGPPIWVMEDDDSKIYFYGTVHLLPNDLPWPVSYTHLTLPTILLV